MATPFLSPLRRFALTVVLAGLAGLALGMAASRRSAPVVRYQQVRVTDTLLVQGEPDTVVLWRERLVHPVVKPQQVATSATGGVSTVTDFCGPSKPPALHGDSATHLAAAGDSSPPSPPAPARMLLLRSGTFDGRELRLWGALNTGEGWTGTYRADAPLSWRAAGDSVLVQRTRLSGLRRTAGRVLLVGVGAAGGYVVGHSLGGGR